MNIKDIRKLVILVCFNSFLIVDIINSLFNLWEGFYTVKLILVLSATLMGTYLSIKGYRNNTLVGVYKFFAYAGFYPFVMVLICMIILVFVIGYMKIMIYLKQ